MWPSSITTNCFNVKVFHVECARNMSARIRSCSRASSSSRRLYAVSPHLSLHSTSSAFRVDFQCEQLRFVELARATFELIQAATARRTRRHNQICRKHLFQFDVRELFLLKEYMIIRTRDHSRRLSAPPKFMTAAATVKPGYRFPCQAFQ